MLEINKSSKYDVNIHIYVNDCIFALTEVSADWISKFHLKDFWIRAFHLKCFWCDNQNVFGVRPFPAQLISYGIKACVCVCVWGEVVNDMTQKKLFLFCHFKNLQNKNNSVNIYLKISNFNKTDLKCGLPQGLNLLYIHFSLVGMQAR